MQVHQHLLSSPKRESHFLEVSKTCPQKYKKWLFSIIYSTMVMINVVTWSFSVKSLLRSDLKMLRMYCWIDIYIMTFYVNFEWCLKIFAVDYSSWIRKYLFQLCVFILKIVFVAIEIYMSKWTFVQKTQLFLLCITLIYALLSVSRYCCIGNNIKNFSEATTHMNESKCIQWKIQGLFLSVAIIVNIFHIALVFGEPTDEEGCLGLLLLLSSMIILILVVECCNDALRNVTMLDNKKKSTIINPALSICGIVSLTMEVINKKYIKGWNEETITLFGSLMGLILFVYIPILFLYVKKLLKNRQILMELKKKPPDFESV